MLVQDTSNPAGRMEIFLLGGSNLDLCTAEVDDEPPRYPGHRPHLDEWEPWEGQYARFDGRREQKKDSRITWLATVMKSSWHSLVMANSLCMDRRGAGMGDLTCTRLRENEYDLMIDRKKPCWLLRMLRGKLNKCLPKHHIKEVFFFAI